MQMDKTSCTSQACDAMSFAAKAVEQMKRYCTAHPASPSAVRRPELLFRGDLWIALLGRTVEHGIVGIGPTVSAALRAFDAQYLCRLCAPNERSAVPA
jgi:hypothetical protein